MAKKPAADKPGRIKQIRMVLAVVRRSDPKAVPIMVLAGVLTVAVFVVAGLIFGNLWFMIPLGLMSGLLVAMILLGRFAQKAQYAMLEGQPGAAAALLESMRGNWTVTPAVAANRNMDVVHRVVGRPGVVLVGEGNRSRLVPLLAAEKKRIARVAADVPIYDFQVGDDEGQIPLRGLQNKVMKLPRTLKNPAVTEINYRLRSLPQSIQMPKGPIPKGTKLPKGPRPKMR